MVFVFSEVEFLTVMLYPDPAVAAAGRFTSPVCEVPKKANITFVSYSFPIVGEMV
jgi:hypothetical protein